MVSFADFMTLLFALFVVLFAISNVDQQKLQTVAESMESAFGVMDASGPSLLNSQPEKTQPIAPVIAPQSPVPPVNPAEKKLIERLENLVKQNAGLAATLDIRREGRGVVLQLQDTRLFASGSAELRPQVRAELRKVGQELARLEQPIRIEGHTDNVPMNGGAFASNWDLSAARATSVLRFFLSETRIPAARFSVAGYGEYRPIASNGTEQGRAKNRRVDIVLLNRQAAEEEPAAPVTADQHLEQALDQKLQKKLDQKLNQRSL